MLNFDSLKDFDITELGRNAPSVTGKPCELPVTKIECDPDNIRKAIDEAAIVQLAETIKADGLLQAITVRHHPAKPGHYIVSYGERRFRAVCLLRSPTIAAVIDDNFDPYRQAIENLQREELDPLDIADWVQKRELAGDTRTLIAKRLGKPKSYISEIALLIKAPTAIREAFKTRRIPDIRTAYLLSRQHEEDPAATSAWLAGSTPITRLEVTKALVKSSRSSAAHSPRSKPAGRRSSAKTKSWNTFAVQVAGREGTMDLTPGPRSTQAMVHFADGSLESVALSKIKLKNWTAL